MIGALVAGVLAGSVYSVIAVALVIVYRTTGILNIALGELATFTLFLYWTADEQWALPVVVAVSVALAASATIGALFDRLVARPLRGFPPVSGLVATVGLTVLLLGVEGKLWGADGRLFSGVFVPRTIDLGGILVSSWQVAAFAIALLLSIATLLLLQRTWLGLAIRATGNDLDGARALGIPVDRVSTIVWVLASLDAAVAGLLLHPTIGFVSPGILTGLFVRGLAAAAIGGMRSPTGAFAGGIVVGVIEAGAAYGAVGTRFDGLQSLGVLLVVLVALVLRHRAVTPSAA